QNSGKLASEFAVGCGFRRHAVYRAGQFGGKHGVAIDAYDVFNMYPWKPLFSAAQRAAQSKLERSQHFLKRAAFSAQYNTSAYGNHPGISLGGTHSFPFPFLADLAHKSLARGRGLFKLLVTAVPIKSDGRAAHEQGRPRLGLAQTFNQVPGG